MICRTCLLNKDVESFGWRNKAQGRRATQCLACRSAYNKAWEAKAGSSRRNALTASNERRRKEQMARAKQYQVERGCADCGERDPLVLDFDHLGDKVMEVSRMYGDFTWDRIMEEIAKCDVVCANDHRRRTARRLADVAQMEERCSRKAQVRGSTPLVGSRGKEMSARLLR